MRSPLLPDITNEMLAAGLEAWSDASLDCLTREETVKEIYWAMVGMAYFDAQSVH